MRALIVFLLVIFGAYTQSIINRLKQAEEGLRASEKELRHLSSRLLEIQEAERKRIAMTLHDDLAQTLAAIKVGLETRRMAMEKDSAPSGVTWDEIVSTTQRGIEKVRRVIMELRPTILDDLGILAAIEWFCREYQAIYPSIIIEKRINIEEREIPDPLKIVIFRLMQEGLNNIVKHSKADRARISLGKADSDIELLLEDNGQGFALEDSSSGPEFLKGLGLSSMKERTGFSGGSFSIESTPGSGTFVRAVWKSMKN